MAEVLRFVHSAPPTLVAAGQDDGSPPPVSENEIRKALRHFVRSNIFSAFIYSVQHIPRTIIEYFRTHDCLQVIIVNTIFIAMDDLWAEMDKDNNFVNKNSYNSDWAILAIFT
jgi:cobalamin biosynthesis Co2+ chelatase CbiK